MSKVLVSSGGDNSDSVSHFQDRGHDDKGGRPREIGPLLLVSICKKQGHVMSEYWVLEKKDKGKVTRANAVVAVPNRVHAEKSVLRSSLCFSGFCLPV